MRKWLLLPAIILALSGCGQIHEDTASHEVSVVKIVKPAYIPEFTNVISDFTENNPDIQIRFVDAPVATGERHQMYVSALDGNDSSIDLYWINDDWTAEFAREGYIAPLDADTDAESYIVDAREAFSFDSKLYALPVGLDMTYLFARNDKPCVAGYNLEAIATECVTAEEDTAVVTAESQDAQDILFNVMEIRNAVGCGYAGALELYKSFIGSRYLTDNTPANYSSEFKSGKSVMMIGKASLRSSLLENTSAVRGVVEMRRMPGDGPGVLTGYGLALNRNSEKKDASLRFLEFLNSNEELRRLSRDCGVMPVTESLYDDDMVLDANPYMKEDIKSFVKNARFCGSFEISGEEYRELEDAFLKYFKNERSAEETGKLIESMLT